MVWFVQHECQQNTLSTAHSTIEVILLRRNHNGKTDQPLQRSGSYILKIHLEAVICIEITMGNSSTTAMILEVTS